MVYEQLSCLKKGKIFMLGFKSRLISSLMLVPCLLFIAAGAQANVIVNSISVPSSVGRGLDVNVDIVWTRINTAAATITTPIPTQLTVNPPTPPIGCTVIAGPSVLCNVPGGGPGSSGTITFPVRGQTIGGFNLVATGTGGSNASISSSVVTAGDLTIGKVKTTPAGNPIAGQSTTFSLTPNIATGGDDFPSTASIVVTDTLPGTATDFTLASRTFTGLNPSCNAVADAQSTRTLTCTYSGPFTRVSLNASTIILTGTPGNNGNFINVANIASANGNYIDTDGSNNTSNALYTVDPGSDLSASGTFPSVPLDINSSQTLRLTYTNNGPMNVPTNGTVSTIIPSGFIPGSLPAGCMNSGAGSLTVSGTNYSGTRIDCTAGPVNVTLNQSFDIPLTMPGVAATGYFPIVVAPPPGFGDAVPANNAVRLPYNVTVPFADLSLSKTKAPGGPQPAGTVITNTLTLTNSATSTKSRSIFPNTALAYR